MSESPSPRPTATWLATLRSVRDAVVADDLDRAVQLVADASRRGALRYSLRERLMGIPWQVTATLRAIEAALSVDDPRVSTVDGPYLQAAKAFVRAGLEWLPTQELSGWRALYTARGQLQVTSSMAWVIPVRAAQDRELQRLFDAAERALGKAGQHAADLGAEATRALATVREMQQTAEAMRAHAEALQERFSISDQPGQE